MHERPADPEEARRSSSLRRSSPGSSTSTGLKEAARRVRLQGWRVRRARSRRSRRCQRRDFKVNTNTTIFSTDTAQSVIDVMNFLNDDLKVDNMQISPAYAYEKAPDQEHFMGVTETRELFQARHSATRPEAVAAEPLAAVPGLPGGQEGVRLHRVGHSLVLAARVAEAVLPDVRRVRGDLQGAHRDHRLGLLRPRQGPALLQLHGALRVRAVRRPGHDVIPAGVDPGAARLVASGPPPPPS